MNKLVDIRLTRRNNIKLISDRYRTQAEFARQCEMNPAQLTQLFKSTTESGEPLRYVGNRLARKIETRLGLEAHWLDVPRDQQVVADLELPGACSRGVAKAVTEELPPRNALLKGGLSHLQLATVQKLVMLAESGTLTDRECIQYLETWTSRLEKISTDKASQANSA